MSNSASFRKTVTIPISTTMQRLVEMRLHVSSYYHVIMMYMCLNEELFFFLVKIDKVKYFFGGDLKNGGINDVLYSCSTRLSEIQPSPKNPQ